MHELMQSSKKTLSSSQSLNFQGLVGPCRPVNQSYNYYKIESLTFANETNCLNGLNATFSSICLRSDNDVIMHFCVIYLHQNDKNINDVILDYFLRSIKWRIQGRPIRPWPPIHFGYGLLQRRKKICSINFLNLCYNFVKKLVVEIRKCRQLKGDFVPLTL